MNKKQQAAQLSRDKGEKNQGHFGKYKFILYLQSLDYYCVSHTYVLDDEEEEEEEEEEGEKKEKKKP